VLDPPEAVGVEHLGAEELGADAHEAAVEDVAPAGGVEAVLFADAVEGLAGSDEYLPFLVVFVALDLRVRALFWDWWLDDRLVEHVVHTHGWFVLEELTSI